MQGVGKMNKRAYIFYLLIFILGFSIAYICGVKMGMEKEYNSEASSVPDNSSNEEGYWVIAVDNVIYVYKSDKKTVVAQTDININHFSSGERNVLTDGIYLENSEELFKYLEANTS
jgi:hypothetical protein